MSEPMMEGPRTRVAIVDDDSLVRVMLRQILSAETDFEVIGESESGEKALDSIRVLLPDVVVVDAEARDAEGAEAMSQVAAEFPSVRVVPLALADLRKIAPETVASGAVLRLDRKNPAIERLLAELRTHLS